MAPDVHRLPSAAPPCVGCVAQEIPEFPEDGARSAAGVAARRHVQELLEELQDCVHYRHCMFAELARCDMCDSRVATSKKDQTHSLSIAVAKVLSSTNIQCKRVKSNESKIVEPS